MPQFAANLSMLFTEVPFLDRFEQAAKAGFQAVEFLFPYAWPAQEIKEKLDANGLTLVLHNLPAGNWEAGERGIACHPGRVAEFQSGTLRAIEYAKVLGVGQLNCLAGIAPAGVPPQQLHDTLVSNLRYAAQALEREGLLLLIEPINRYDIPGFHLNRSDQAAQILAEVGAANLRIQFDIYHAQRSEGELAQTIERLWPLIGHIQIADNPGRHEPGSGEINYNFLLSQIDRLGYSGWIGCEYKPALGTKAGLAWRDAYAT